MLDLFVAAPPGVAAIAGAVVGLSRRGHGDDFVELGIKRSSVSELRITGTRKTMFFTQVRPLNVR
jgi:hypothetical protein